MRSLVAIGVLTSFTLVHSQPAQACSAVQACDADLFPTNGNVPVNLLAWTWNDYAPSQEVDGGAGVQASVHVFVEAEVDVELELEQIETEPHWFRLKPRSQPPVGSVLRVELSSPCIGEQPRIFHVEVTEAVTPPAHLGTLEGSPASGYLEIGNSSPSCTGKYYTRYVDVELRLDDASSEVEGVLRHSLWVDGVPRFSRDTVYEEDGSWPPPGRTIAAGPLGRWHERAFALCDDGQGDLEWLDDVGLSPGVHQLQMVATLADGTELKSNELEVDLTCTQCNIAHELVACDGEAAPPKVKPSNDKADEGAGACSYAVAPSAPRWPFALTVLALAFGVRRRRGLHR